MFPYSADYIIYLVKGTYPLPRLLGYLVVEHFPIRNLAADYQLLKYLGLLLPYTIFLIFSEFPLHSRLSLFHDYVVA